MQSIKITELSLDEVAASGQCFTWRALPGGAYAITSGAHYVEVRQRGEMFDFSCDQATVDAYWRAYFDVDTDYSAVKALIDPKDAYLSAAVRYGAGMRVLRQELWDVMVCFLLSQNNNVGRIKNSVTALCARYGEVRERTDGAGVYHAFPTPDRLAKATADELATLGLGYRAKYLEALAHAMQGDGLAAFQRALNAADDETAIKQLVGLYGIGRKVADCIGLYGLHRIDRFPMDTHIRQILKTQYPNGFPFARYRGYLGIIQQYLFYYKLTAGAGNPHKSTGADEAGT